jgi:hypothetical protein
VPLDEITREILPYRTNRRALQLDTSEDYELMLLRLCAGEGSLVRTEPEEARSRFAEELRSANPDLEVLHAFENVLLTISPESLARALEAGPETAYAPPGRGPEREAEPRPDVVLGTAQFDHVPGLGEVAPGVEALRGLPLVEEPADVEDRSHPGETPGEDGAPSCVFCGGSLPVHRPVNFCPHCGQSQTQILCPECGSEVEPGWRHCVNCGAVVGEG